MESGRPTFWLIAGPSGVGRTSFAMRRLEAVSGSINFINLSEIARGLSPLRPAAAVFNAGRIALTRARAFIVARETFAWETTLSGLTQARFLELASRHKVRTALLYFSARDPAICLERIARRVAEGGHNVPEAIVRRRFARSLRHLPHYLPLVDLWRVYEASGPRPALAIEGQRTSIVFRDDAVLANAHTSVRALAEP